MVTILALAAAVLYGTADFLGGVASRRARVFAVLAITVPAGTVVVVVVAWLGQVMGLGGLLGHGDLGAFVSAGGWGAVGWAAAVRCLRGVRPDRLLRRFRDRADQRRGARGCARLHRASGRRRYC